MNAPAYFAELLDDREIVPPVVGVPVFDDDEQVGTACVFRWTTDSVERLRAACDLYLHGAWSEDDDP